MGWASSSEPQRSREKFGKGDVCKSAGRGKSGFAGEAKAGRTYGTSEKRPFRVPAPGKRGK